MTNEEKAAVYRQSIICQDCMCFDQCSKELKQPNLKRIYGCGCTKTLVKAFESDLIGEIEYHVEYSYDWNLPPDADELRIVEAYRRIFRYETEV